MSKYVNHFEIDFYHISTPVQSKITSDNLEGIYSNLCTACLHGSCVNRIPARVSNMAPHGKEMTPAVKELILKLSYEGYSHAKISKVTGKNRQSVSRIIQRCQMRDDDENNSERGKAKPE